MGALRIVPLTPGRWTDFVEQFGPRGACAHVRARGGRIFEGYPVDPGERRYAPTFAWHGLAAAFRSAGFKEVAGRSAMRPIMRRTLGPGRRTRAGTRG